MLTLAGNMMFFLAVLTVIIYTVHSRYIVYARTGMYRWTET